MGTTPEQTKREVDLLARHTPEELARMLAALETEHQRAVKERDDILFDSKRVAEMNQAQERQEHAQAPQKPKHKARGKHDDEHGSTFDDPEQ